MASAKISQLASLASPANNDLLVVVDVSDTTMGPAGTNKKIVKSSLFEAPFIATTTWEVSQANGVAPFGTYKTQAYFTYDHTDVPSRTGLSLTWYTTNAVYPYALSTYFTGDGNFATSLHFLHGNKRNPDGLIQGVSAIADGAEPNMVACSPDVNGPCYAVESPGPSGPGEGNGAALAVYDSNDIHSGSGPYSNGYGKKKFQITGDGTQWWGSNLSNTPTTSYLLRLKPINLGTTPGFQLTGNLGIGVDPGSNALAAVGNVNFSNSNFSFAMAASGGFGIINNAGATWLFRVMDGGSVAMGIEGGQNRLNVAGAAAIGSAAFAGATTAPTNGLAVEGVISAGAPVRLKGYTVGTLPAGTVGDKAYVTDATAPTYLGALVGGGAVTCPVFYNGSAWVSA